MIQEHVYICWHHGQDEGDGKEVKAATIRAAAKKAVDIWRHENVEELGNNKVTVYVKDEALKTHEMIITQTGDTQAPEAFI